MPYRVQVQSDFDWRIGQSPSGSAPWRMVAAGSASSLVDAQSQAQAARARDQAALAGRSDALIFDQSFPD